MWTRFFLAPAAAATILAASPDLPVVQLQPKTLTAFERYVTATEARIATELDGRKPFLRVDRLDAAAKADAMARLNRGEVVAERLEDLGERQEDQGRRRHDPSLDRLGTVAGCVAVEGESGGGTVRPVSAGPRADGAARQHPAAHR